MTRYGVPPNPNPDFIVLSATPHHLHSQSQQLGPAVDIGLASLRLDRLIDCLVPALGACFIPAEPKAHNYETGTCLSYVSISGLQILLLPSSPFLSEKSQDCDIYRQSSILPRADRATTQDIRPQLQDLDDNTPTRFPRRTRP